MLSSFQQLLTELAQQVGLDGPSLLAQQEVCIDGLSIFLQHSGEEDEDGADVLLCSVLGALPQQRFAEVVRTLLQANHQWVGTGGGTLGLSPAGDAVTWCLRLPLRDLDGATLAALLGEVVPLGLAWMRYLGAEAQEAGGVPEQAFLMNVRA